MRILAALLLGLFASLALAGDIDQLCYCTYNLDLRPGDTFQIRDYVTYCDSSRRGQPVDWSQGNIYFTYTLAGADDPTIPADWHLADFNANTPVTVTVADAQQIANHGDGRYRIYIARTGQAKFDDHMTIRVSTDPNAPSDVSNPENINLAKCSTEQPATDCTTVEVKSTSVTAAELRQQVASALGVPLEAVEVKSFFKCQGDKRCAEICFHTVIIPPAPTTAAAVTSATSATTGATSAATTGVVPTDTTTTGASTTGTATTGSVTPTGEVKTATEIIREFTFTVNDECNTTKCQNDSTTASLQRTFVPGTADKGLSKGAKAAIISGGVIAAIVIAGIVGFVIISYAAKKGYDYVSVKNMNMAAAHENPLHKPATTDQANALYGGNAA